MAAVHIVAEDEVPVLALIFQCPSCFFDSLTCQVHHLVRADMLVQVLQKLLCEVAVSHRWKLDGATVCITRLGDEDVVGYWSRVLLFAEGALEGLRVCHKAAAV